VTTGVSYRLLDVPGADRLAGAGVFYGAAITEALSVKGEDVFVVGGGNSAILIRGQSLADSMSQYLVERIDEAENIDVRTGASISELHGEQALEEVSVRSDSGTTREKVRAVFVFIGAEPRTQWLNGSLQQDDKGFLLSGLDLARDGASKPAGWMVEREPFWLEANVPGIFVAGDIRHRSTKRIASAVGEGAMAIQFVHQHLGGSTAAPGARAPAKAKS
jgi:thioredoxin reductase (NADPH)